MVVAKSSKKKVTSTLMEDKVSAILFNKVNSRREKLSDDQKRENHVTSEQRRREILREYYDELVSKVPDLDESERRSEWQIYMKTKSYLCWLYARNQQLRNHLEDFNIACPQHLVWEYPDAVNKSG
ncbi:HGL225Wp [Eremothecium sinecaudum]|uniref:HGL225Wp n=1 Tax=Eremothecium sinecaudum TaxID=45286 RepID=A0A0X8HVF2_9SACH|nr:HGL225Wp [Eremothecium sinecaudum]AMD22115.1 HGL225Wp [Eremothecium sinecaudum]